MDSRNIRMFSNCLTFHEIPPEKKFGDRHVDESGLRNVVRDSIRVKGGVILHVIFINENGNSDSCDQLKQAFR